MKKDAKEPSGLDGETLWYTALFAMESGLSFLLSIITRYFPFNHIFTNRLFHAKWLGAYRIIKMVDLTAHAFSNRFNIENFEKDENYYYISGSFDKKPSENIFKSIQKCAGEEGLDIKYCGVVEDGTHRFIAPVNQKWKWTLF